MSSDAALSAPSGRFPAGGRLIPAAIALATLGYAITLPVQPPDFHQYLIPWYEHIRHEGAVGAFAAPFSNYSPPYLYLLAIASLTAPVVAPAAAIKVIAVVGTAFLALAVADVMRACGQARPASYGVSAFLIPTVILNAAFLGQCDTIWSAASLLAVAGAIRKKPVEMLVWAGVAVSFKAQAALLAPFLFAMLLRWRSPLHLWLIPPAVFVAMMLPAWLAGWPAMDLLLVYPRQTDAVPNFVGSAANPWIFVPHMMSKPRAMSLVPFGLALGAAAAVFLVGYLPRRSATPVATLAAALLSAALLPWILPKMHERFFFLADMLALCLAYAAGNRRTIQMAVFMQVASTLAILTYVLRALLRTHAVDLLAMAGAGLTATVILFAVAILRDQDATEGSEHGGALQRRPVAAGLTDEACV